MTGAGRPEKPVDQTVPDSARLAEFLRSRREAAGLTYRDMAIFGGGRRSAATLERAAAGGPSVASWDTVELYVGVTITDEEHFTGAFAGICGEARDLWIRARRATRASHYVHTAPDPTLIATKADFCRALRDQHAWGGAPSSGEMEQAAGPGHLPRTTARRIIKGEILPVTPQQCIAFLRACNVDVETLVLWLHAGSRATRDGRWREAYEHQALLYLADKSETLTGTEPFLRAVA
ncbi:helix-turn-helix domain-containing protein [Actinacidiphila rubida]|uniref:Helix-turn-helix domain-containing protein n=1 Tax=Actinacidiphila rubida TaxID=310780 RepID=A0A1H8UHE4_9ACTN|nr:helix-turn-helix transcriptional regulator [Actinacidiphila rubida]SEP02640.1 hypothetical protein SAMN05216267_107315 [Actinacidiphila rubida]